MNAHENRIKIIRVIAWLLLVANVIGSFYIAYAVGQLMGRPATTIITFVITFAIAVLITVILLVFADNSENIAEMKWAMVACNAAVSDEIKSRKAVVPQQANPKPVEPNKQVQISPDSNDKWRSCEFCQKLYNKLLVSCPHCGHAD
ncbi:MAG: hypothetical protein FWE34_01930 [Defluviitaleaceae bacterium]|nr:hypothetical protein [Defluviitaleaceae bacterium]